MDLPSHITSIEACHGSTTLGTPDGLIFDTNSNQHWPLSFECWPTPKYFNMRAGCANQQNFAGPTETNWPKPLVSFSKETPRGKVKSCDCHPSTYYSDVNLGTPRLRSIDITHTARMMMNHNLPWWRTFILTVPDPEEIPLFHGKCCHIWFWCCFPVPFLCGERARPGSNQRFPCGYHGPGGQSWPLQVL